MFVEAEWVSTVPHGNDRAYWCAQSELQIGPNGKLVDDYECNETRSCYAEL